MSYEGRYQTLCKNGHYCIVDAYIDYPTCHCGQSIVWENGVDDTNGEEYGIVPDDVFASWEISPAKYETCNLGHRHCVEEAVYKIPSKEERKAARHYYDAASNSYVKVKG